MNPVQAARCLLATPYRPANPWAALAAAALMAIAAVAMAVAVVWGPGVEISGPPA